MLLAQIALAVCSCALALAQGLAPVERVWRRIGDLDGPFVFDQYQWIAPCIGDVDGDGHGDLALRVDRRTYSPPGFVHSDERVWIVSGADGRLLRAMEKLGRPFGSFVHGLAAVGDMDGDGTPDYAVASHDTGGRRPQLLHVRSGRDDTLILQLESQSDIAWAAGILGDVDLDGDARRDLAVTYYGHQEGGETVGRIEAYRGDGQPLYTIRGDPGALRYLHGFPRSIGKIGDLDGDGGDDFGVGALDRVQGNAGIAVHSGRTGRLLYYAHDPAYAGVALGREVRGCGDMDGDGKPDFVASQDGLTVVFSGATGRSLRSWFGVGRSVAAADFDRDGVPDVAAAANDLVVGFSGRDGAKLFSIAEGALGFFLDVPAAPADGFPRLSAVDPTYGLFNGWQGVGSFYRGCSLLLRSVPRGTAVAGAGCARGLPSPPRIGFRQVEHADAARPTARVLVSGAPAGALAFLLLGSSDAMFGAFRLPLDLGAFGWPGCTLYTSVDAILPVTTGTAGLGRGYGCADVPLEVAPQGPGTVPLFAQWKVLDPISGGIGLSELLTWHVRL
jgi:hypothetical protein